MIPQGCRAYLKAQKEVGNLEVSIRQLQQMSFGAVDQVQPQKKPDAAECYYESGGDLKAAWKLTCSWTVIASSCSKSWVNSCFHRCCMHSTWDSHEGLHGQA